MKKYIYPVLFIATVYLSNWLLSHFGYCDTMPCVIPLGFGLYAPSGVIAVGLAFTIRDLVQHYFGVKWTMACILIGAVLSAYLSPSLAVASGVAFLFSETMDLLVYTPLHKKSFIVAFVVSNIVGLIADSMLFLWLAFGSFDFLLGQIVGKFLMTLIVLPIILMIRKRL